MPNTYTQLHIQIVFAVKDRRSLINVKWEQELFKYVTGIIQSYNHKLLIINGTSDHIHLFIGLRPHQALSDLVRIVKSSSSKWINESGYLNSKFSWQEGYGAFSYSQSHIQNVVNYIKNQKEHHGKRSFTEEYIEFLESFEVEYDPQYIFKEIKE